MIRYRPSLLLLVPMLVIGCSTTQSGTAVVGPTTAVSAVSSSAVPFGAVASGAGSSSAVSSSAGSSSAGSSGSAVSSRAVSSGSAVSSRSVTPPPTTTSPSRTTAGTSTTASSPTTSAPASFLLCEKVSPTDTTALVSCLRNSLSQFWSGQLDEVVDQPVVVEPTSAQVPRQCRSAITTTAAFTCQVDNTVYLNSGLLDAARKNFPAAEEPYVFATVLGHEIGHVVQAAVQQPGYDDATNSDEISQRIEQQADCLDGVWAYSAVAAHQLDRATFVRVTNAFLTSISSNPEIATHGTPPQRAAALAKGLKNGRPQDCGLATFS